MQRTHTIQLNSKKTKEQNKSTNKKEPNLIKKWAEDLKWHFSKDMQMTNRHIKKMIDVTNHQGNANQNHSEILSHICQMAVISKTTNNKCWQGCREKGILVHCWWDCKLVLPLWKTVWSFLKKLKIDLSYDPGISFLGIYLKKIKTLIQKDTYIPMFIATLFTIAKYGSNLSDQQ